MIKKKRIFFETEEVVRKTKRGYIDLETDYFQFYNIAFHHIASLSNNCAKDFILWVMTQVDNDNKFIYGKKMYDDFMHALDCIRKPKKYDSLYMYKALNELTEQDIITKLPGRGNYRVNPKLFWSNETSKRITAVKHIESNSRVDTQSTDGFPIEIPNQTENATIESFVSAGSGE